MRQVVVGILSIFLASAQYQNVVLDSTGHRSKIYTSAWRKPDFSAFAWVQQEGASIDLTGTLPVFSFLGNTGNGHERMFLTPLHAPPYTAILGVTLTFPGTSATGVASLVLRNSVTDKGLFVLNEVWANQQTIAAFHTPKILSVQENDYQVSIFDNHLGVGSAGVSQQWCLKAQDDGTNLSLWSSNDGCVNWEKEYQEASGSYSTFDQVGIAGYTYDTSAHPGFVLSLWRWSLQ